MNKNSEKTRAHILRAAAEIFAEKGFRAATVRQICAKADANIAAINYHFNSKEDLYYETFKYVFQDANALKHTGKPVVVRNAAEWRQALYAWAHSLLDQVTSPQKTRAWENKLYARERLDPSRVLPVLMDEFLLPISDRLEHLLLMGMPENQDPARIQTWVVSIIGHCSMYSLLEAPWDKLLFPEKCPRQEWLHTTATFIVDGICSRLVFRTGNIPTSERVGKPAPN